MPYSVTQEHPDCAGWAVVKDEDNTLMGCHETKADAQAQLTAINIAESEQRSIPLTNKMRASAQRGLGYWADGLAGDGLQESTVEEARAIARGEIDEDKVTRMGAWIARHRVDWEGVPQNSDQTDERFPGPGAVAAYLWAVNPTDPEDADRVIAWCERYIASEEIEPEEESASTEARGSSCSTNALLLALMSGREVRHGDHDQSSHGAWATGAMATMGKGSSAEVFAARGSVAGATKNSWNNYENTELVGQMYAERGFNGKPSVVSQEEFDRAEGELVYRGVTSSEHAADLTGADTHRVGENGMYGSGTYTASAVNGGDDPAATALETARDYAGVSEDRLSLEHQDAKIMEMKLDKSANVATLEEIRNEGGRLSAEANVEKMATLHKIDQELASGSISAEQAAIQRSQAEDIEASANAFYGDEGAVATWLGYDAVRIPSRVDEEEWLLVLNRSKLIVNADSRVPLTTEGDN